MKILQETTDWSDAKHPVFNGIYHVNDAGHLVAYQGKDGVLKTFTNPLKTFSRSRRTFREIKQ